MMSIWQSDDRILVAGTYSNGADDDIMVVRFNAFGILDQTFGNNGTVLLDGGDYDRGYGVDIDSQGNILVTGLRTQPETYRTDYDIPVLRLDPNGILDTTFGTQGVYSYNPTENTEWGYGLVLQPDSKIVVADQFSSGKHILPFSAQKIGATGLEPATS